MQLQFSTPEDFIDEVKRSHEVYQNAVRMLVDRNALQPEEVTFGIDVIVTALLVQEDGTEYIAAYSSHLGIDRAGHENGTEALSRLKRLFEDLLPQEICVRPGKIEA